MSNFELWWTHHICISPLDWCIYYEMCLCRTSFILHILSLPCGWFQRSPSGMNQCVSLFGHLVEKGLPAPFFTDRWIGSVCWVIWAILRDKWKKELFINGQCWWFRNPKQPPGMYKTLVNPGVNYQPQLVQDFFDQKYEPRRDKCIGVFGWYWNSHIAERSFVPGMFI